MRALFNSYLDLVLMRLAPQAFPASWFLFGLVLVAFLAMMLASNYLLSGELAFAAVRTALSGFNLCVGTALILTLAGRWPRWRQTATALLGGETVIGLVLLPVLMVRAAGIENIFIALSLLAFFVWELMFFGHVYRNALDTGMGAGIAVGLIYVIASALAEQALVPFPQR